MTGMAAGGWEEEREHHWRSLFLFSLYRVLSALLFMVLGGWAFTHHSLRPERVGTDFALSGAYFVLGVGFALLSRRQRELFPLATVGAR